MANLHGKNAAIYVGDGTNAAIPVSEQNTYSIDSDFDTAEVTALGDTWATQVKGILKWSGKIDGNFDTASKQLWLAHTASSAQKFYLYPDRSTTTQYYYGTVWLKVNNVLGGGIGASSKTSCSIVGQGALVPQP